jgi:VIT1/CCC1 family predicted Fe2+/Mn2+ transporter
MLVTIAMLALLGAVGAKAGGAPILPGVTRVVIFGTAAMVITALAGHLFHAAS